MIERKEYESIINEYLLFFERTSLFMNSIAPKESQANTKQLMEIMDNIKEMFLKSKFGIRID